MGWHVLQIFFLLTIGEEHCDPGSCIQEFVLMKWKITLIFDKTDQRKSSFGGTLQSGS